MTDRVQAAWVPLAGGRGFRLFFLLAGVAAAVLVPVWIANYLLYLPLATYYDPVGWHAHEMLFGFTSAVIAGFLLTAVRGWTDIETLRGAPLLALATLWIAGRLLPLFPLSVPRPLVAVVDLAFLPCLLLAILPPLLRDGRMRNLAVVPVVAFLFLANFLGHLEILGLLRLTARGGNYMAVDVVALLIVVIGGRVIPFFTERAVAGSAPQRLAVVEWLAVASSGGLVLVAPFARSSSAACVLAVLAAVTNGWRLALWHDRRIWRLPLLWVLYTGYAWVVVGFAMRAAAILGEVPAILALHALTAGAIGVLTLGMMARVSLGHTGRRLEPPGVMVAAFVLANAAALLRSVMPVLAPLAYGRLVAAAGVFWAAAFALFVVSFAPMLTRARVDGRPD